MKGPGEHIKLRVLSGEVLYKNLLKRSPLKKGDIVRHSTRRDVLKSPRERVRRHFKNQPVSPTLSLIPLPQGGPGDPPLRL